jgi:hypothetical protein
VSAQRLAPGLLAAALALAWLAFAPATPDLAAQVYRAELFDREGYTLYDLYWYGGHHMPGYSLLFPPLGALAGVRVVGVLAAVASAVLFERIARRHFGASARWGALLFGAGTVADLLIGRVTFALGVALALASVLALQHARTALALALAVACSIASPVAGLFLALAGVTYWLARGERASSGVALAAAAFAPAVALAVLFPDGGIQPFPTVAFATTVLCCLVVLWLLPREERVLRTGALLYLGSTVLAFVVASPMGSNAGRLGVAFAAPLLLCAALAPTMPRGRRRLALAAILPLLVWQAWAPVRETLKGAGDPSAQRAYFAGVMTFLEARPEPVRVEVPFTRLHWESVHVARTTALARGWMTQLDVKYNPLFRAGAAPLTPNRYRAWLRREGVRYVALPDVPLDPAGRAEADLLRAGLPYLRPVFEDRHWKVFEVVGTPGLTNGVGRLTRMGPQSFTLRVRRPGLTFVRVRHTPYWEVAGGAGCVSRAAGGWTHVSAPRAGAIRVTASFDPRRILRPGIRCRAAGRHP